MELNICNLDALIQNIEAEASEHEVDKAISVAEKSAYTCANRTVPHINAVSLNASVYRCTVQNNVVSENSTACRIPIFGKLISAFRKLIRKMLRFYILPIVNQQNVFNASVTDALSSLNAAPAKDAELEARIDALSYAMYLRQKSDLDVLRSEVNELKEANAALEKKLDSLNDKAGR